MLLIRIGVGVRAAVYVQACLAVLNCAYLYFHPFHNSDPPDNQESQRSVDAEPSTLHIPSHTTSPSPSTVAPIASSINDQSPNLTHLEEGRSTNLPDPPAEATADSPSEPSDDTLMAEMVPYYTLAKNLEHSIYMVGLAVIVSALIELITSPDGLTPYHALIVLNISLINNWMGLLLYYSRVGVFKLKENLAGRRAKIQLHSLAHALSGRGSGIWSFFHNMLNGILGVLFWVAPSIFHKYARQSPPCQPLVFYWVFVAKPINDETLVRLASVLYEFTIIPIIGFHMHGLVFTTAWFPGLVWLIVSAYILVMGQFIGYILLLFVALVLWPFKGQQRVNQAIEKAESWCKSFAKTIPLFFALPLVLLLPMQPGTQHFNLFLILGACIPFIWMIVSTEQIIKINAPYVDESSERHWTYGQTLALLCALINVGMFVYEWGKAYGKWRRRRREQRIKIAQKSLKADEQKTVKDETREGVMPT
jgi:hypothetical protein